MVNSGDAKWNKPQRIKMVSRSLVDIQITDRQNVDIQTEDTNLYVDITYQLPYPNQTYST
jgi:hypothetical protein